MLLSLALLALALFVPVLAVSWLVATSTGLAALVSMASHASANALVIEGAEGSLIDAPRFARITYADNERRVEARTVEIDWRPRALFDSRVVVTQLRIGTLDVATRPSDAVPTLPADLRLAWPVAIGELRIARMRLKAWESAAGTEALVFAELTDARLGATSDGRHHGFDLGFASPAGRVKLDGELDGVAPFALGATLALDGARGDEPYAVTARADGPLAAIAVTVRASGWKLAGAGRLELTPFAPVPLKSASVDVSGINPAALRPGAPEAALDLKLQLEPVLTQGAAPASIDDWVLAGPVELVNRAPGALDRHRLPLTGMSARATWKNAELALEELVIVFSGKSPGRASGRASLRERVLRTRLAVTGLDPHEFVTTLKSTRLAGDIEATAGEVEQSLVASLRESAAPRGRAAWRAEIVASHKNGEVALKSARLVAGAASLDASGRMNLAANQAFSVTGKLARFDPALYANVPHALLNADLTATGELMPQPRVDLEFGLRDSTHTTRDGVRALSGRGTLSLSPDRLARADLALDLAGNRVNAKGAWGRVGDRLQLTLAAPRLDTLGFGLGGKLDAEADIGGTLAAPSGTVSASAQALRLPGAVRIDTLALRAALQDGFDGRIDGSLKAAGIGVGAGTQAFAQELSATITGTRGAHLLAGQLRLTATESVEFAASGGLAANLAWNGAIDRLEGQGARASLSLIAPAPLSVAPAQVVLGLAELKVDGAPSIARLSLRESRWTPAGWRSRGDFTGLQAGALRDAGQRVVAMARTLRLGGNWDITAATQLDGSARVFRESGDVTILGDKPFTLGLTDLRLEMAVARDVIDATLVAAGARLGRVEGGAGFSVRRAGSAWQLARDAPLTAHAQIAMPQLTWLGPLIDPNVQLAGSLAGDLRVTGTPDRPQARGTLRGTGLEVALVGEGLRLTDGEMTIEFTEEKARLVALAFRADPRVQPREARIDYAALTRTPGRLTGSGELRLSDGRGSIALAADKLAVLQRADRYLMLSGTLAINTAWDAIGVTGKLTADAGYFELAAEAPPALSDDVVILGRQGSPGQPLRLSVDIEAALGERVYFNGRGLDTRLTGSVRLRALPRSPLRLTGSIATSGGSFDAYGQKLAIDRGIVNFQGPIDGAGLNVRALRRGLAVEAGVEVTGTVRRPQVRLVSEPNVPDADKLSWIVLGRGQDQGGVDAALLLSAASAILGGSSGGMSRQIAQGLGLDQIDVRTGDLSGGGSRLPSSTVAGSTSATNTNLSSQIVTVGKRLSSRAFLSYEQSLASAASVLKLTYSLTRGFALVGRAGSDNSVDLTYTFSFD